MSPDFLDLLRAFLGANARFLVVGAYAVGVHGRPRATKDLDVWVEASDESSPLVMRGLIEFGAPLMGLTEADLKKPGIELQIGVEPGRIDVLTKIAASHSKRHGPDVSRLTSATESAARSSDWTRFCVTSGRPPARRTWQTSTRSNA